MVTGRQNTVHNVAAGAILVALPVTILYMSLQKYLIRGISGRCIENLMIDPANVETCWDHEAGK